MNAFEEFMFDENYVLRFYRVDHGLVCTINESMVSELREVESKLRQQQAEIEALKKSCLDEIFKRTYANQSAKVMEGYLQEAQAEIEALKLQIHTTLTNRDLRTYDGKAQEK